jgi:hypothetical protein
MLLFCLILPAGNKLYILYSGNSVFGGIIIVCSVHLIQRSQHIHHNGCSAFIITKY